MTTATLSPHAGTGRSVRKGASLLLLVIAAILLSSCAQKTSIVIDGPWVRPAPLPDRSGAGYTTLHNYSDEPDVMGAVTVDFAEMAAVHESVGTAGDTITKQPTGPLEVPPHGSLSSRRAAIASC